jgi:hypothetical protein
VTTPCTPEQAAELIPAKYRYLRYSYILTAAQVAEILNAALSQQAPAEAMEQVRKGFVTYEALLAWADRNSIHGINDERRLRLAVEDAATLHLDAAIERSKREG